MEPMTSLTLFQLLETFGPAPLMAVLGVLLWRIEKAVTVLTVKMEYAVGLRTRDEANKVLRKSGESV